MIGDDGKSVPLTDWTLHYENVAPRHEGPREALCALGNGYFATRGAAPESHADGVHYRRGVRQVRMLGIPSMRLTCQALLDIVSTRTSRRRQ